MPCPAVWIDIDCVNVQIAYNQMSFVARGVFFEVTRNDLQTG